MDKERGDLILAQGMYAFIQDGASGQVEVVVGPHKVSLAETDRPSIQDERSMVFEHTTSSHAMTPFKTAHEGQYIVLKNPVEGNANFPSKGKQTAPSLKIGNKINIHGPKSFALYPGQFADVIDGHHLKSNEFLIIRVYNEIAALDNLSDSVVKTTNDETDPAETETKDSKKSTKNNKDVEKESRSELINKKDIVTGKLMIIKGTDVSFYIPPTGIEVLKDENGKYVRSAVTLERLEYCILLDQNGNKRFVKGPEVVFPEPTEEFIEKDGVRKFKAIELNPNMGIYIKVIADYAEGDKIFKAGEELFITGKEQRIYYPRQEHALITYDNNAVHYAIALPDGEGRYMLNKESGVVSLIEGPKMLMPDPRNQVIVKRILDEKNVQLMYPGNTEAIEYNRVLMEKKLALREQDLQTEMMRGESDSNRDYSNSFLSSSDLENIGEFMSGEDDDYKQPLTRGFLSKRKKALRSGTEVGDIGRSATYTKPRTITLDNKYDGAVKLNIWPGFAVQVVSRGGERRVVEGPQTVLLKYEEFLDVLALSTGKPKSDHHLEKTVYLQTKNNVVSDIVSVETEDFVQVDIRLSYRVNFVDDNKVWFNVANYVKLMTQHLRSVIRNEVHNYKIEEFNAKAANIVRDIVLGDKNDAGKREGKLFSENNMHVYDVEVLDVKIKDENVGYLLRDSQISTVKRNLEKRTAKEELEYTKEIESFKREEISEKTKTSEAIHIADKKSADQQRELEEAKQTHKVKLQKSLDQIHDAELAREDKENAQEVNLKKQLSEIEINEISAKLKAVSPELSQALNTVSGASINEILAKHLKYRENGLFGKNGGFEALMETLKGSPLESQLTQFIKNIKQATADAEV
jgi:major vault protein